MPKFKKSNKTQNKPFLDFDKPLQLENHKRPITRRDFLGQGLVAGSAAILVPTVYGLSAKKAEAAADTLIDSAMCKLGGGTGKIPFICIDLSGGANIAGSNALVGGPAGQMDFLTDGGYEKLGLPATMIPSLAGQTSTLAKDANGGDVGLKFHADSALLRGIREMATQATLDNVNGAVLCARSSNDTSDNPHNPMYGIYKAGADGDILSLIGSRSSESGGRSVAPPSMVDLSVRPTKISSGNDARGLIDTGRLADLLPNEGDALKVMEAIQRISALKLQKTPLEVDKKITMGCRYFEANKAASVDADRTDIMADTDLTTLFTAANRNLADFEKTASVTKLVVNGLAGAGTIQFGGYDYHDSTRVTGEDRDQSAGRQIGIALEYAKLVGQKVMIYLFSDGSVASNGTLDSTGKGIWKGDNSSTSASLILVYDPAKMPVMTTDINGVDKNQIGYFRPDGSIETNATVISNNVTQLVESVVLNYMALNGEMGQFTSIFPDHGLGATAAELDALVAFESLNG